jgi:hypothetical protein
MAVLLGKDAKLYLLSGTSARSAWSGSGSTNLVEISGVRDVKVAGSMSESDVTTRASNGFKLQVPTLEDSSLDFSMPYDTAAAGMTNMAAAYIGRTTVAVAVLSGARTTTGNTGVWADWHVFKFERSQNLSDAQMIDVTLKPAPSIVAPEWVTTS